MAESRIGAGKVENEPVSLDCLGGANKKIFQKANMLKGQRSQLEGTSVVCIWGAFNIRKHNGS